MFSSSLPTPFRTQVFASPRSRAPAAPAPPVDIQHDPEVQKAVLRAWSTGKFVATVSCGSCALLGVLLRDGTSFVRGKRLTSLSKGNLCAPRTTMRHATSKTLSGGRAPSTPLRPAGSLA